MFLEITGIASLTLDKKPPQKFIINSTKIKVISEYNVNRVPEYTWVIEFGARLKVIVTNEEMERIKKKLDVIKL